MWRLFLMSCLVAIAPSCATTSPDPARSNLDVSVDVGPTPDATPDAAPDAEVDATIIPVGPAQIMNDRAFLPAALALIASAQQRIYMIQFVIYDNGSVRTLLDALIAAKARGVNVMVLADEEADQTRSALERLQAAGIETKFDSPAVTTHNKLIIVDDATLLGSHNLSSNALDRNTEAAILVRRPEVTAFYGQYFQAMWTDSTTDPTLSWDGAEDIIPIKNRGIVDRLRRCIEGANHNVQLVLYAMTYKPEYPDSDPIALVNALIAAHTRGVQVRVALDASDWIRENAINAMAEAILLDAGVDVRPTPTRDVTHAKALKCDDTVIIGDANWAYSAFSLYNGTSVEVTRPETARQFDTWFDHIWTRSAPTD